MLKRKRYQDNNNLFELYQDNNNLFEAIICILFPIR